MVVYGKSDCGPCPCNVNRRPVPILAQNMACVLCYLMDFISIIIIITITTIIIIITIIIITIIIITIIIITIIIITIIIITIIIIIIITTTIVVVIIVISDALLHSQFVRPFFCLPDSNPHSQSPFVIAVRTASRPS